MLYELSVYLLSVYLLNGFRCLFLGGGTGIIISGIACWLVSLHPMGNRVPGNDIALSDWVIWGLTVGAILGLGGSILFSYRRLHAEQAYHNEHLIASNDSVWPPTPKHDISGFIIKGNSKRPFLKALGLVFVCFLFLMIGASIYIHFELLRECGNHYGGLCAP